MDVKKLINRSLQQKLNIKMDESVVIVKMSNFILSSLKNKENLEQIIFIMNLFQTMITNDQLKNSCLPILVENNIVDLYLNILANQQNYIIDE